MTGRNVSAVGVSRERGRVSRGLGWVQQTALEYLRSRRVPVSSRSVALSVYGFGSPLSRAQLSATARALQGLEERGLVVRGEWRRGRRSLWVASVEGEGADR